MSNAPALGLARCWEGRAGKMMFFNITATLIHFKSWQVLISKPSRKSGRDGQESSKWKDFRQRAGGNGAEDISLGVSCLESEAWDRFEELQVMLCEQLHAPTSLSQSAPPAQLQNTTLYLQRVN